MSSISRLPEILQATTSSQVSLSDEEIYTQVSKMPIAERRKLSPETIARFYNYCFQEHKVRINPRHFEKTYEQLDCFPKNVRHYPPKKFLESFHRLIKRNPELMARVASEESEFQGNKHDSANSLEKFEKGIRKIVQTATKISKHSENDSSDSSLEGESKALPTLLSHLIYRWRHGKLTDEQKANYFRTIAIGGLHCNRGKNIELHHVYSQLMGATGPGQRILKTLLLIRESVMDAAVLAHDSNKNETVETKLNVAALIGKSLGLATATLVEDDSFTLDLAKVHDDAYKRELIQIMFKETLQADSSEADDSGLMYAISECVEESIGIARSFVDHYTPELILANIYEQSRDLKLYEWFRDNPPDDFVGDYDEFIQDFVLEPYSLTVKKEFIAQILEAEDILTFC